MQQEQATSNGAKGELMDEEKLASLIERHVGKALEDKLSSFYVEREQHFLDHEFVKDIRVGVGRIKGAACGAVTKTLVTIVFILLGWGVVHFIQSVIGKGGNK